MSAHTVTRAWKDEEFMASLTEGERAALPANPAGAIELPDDVLSQVNGGAWESYGSFCRTCNLYCKLTEEFGCFPIGIPA